MDDETPEERQNNEFEALKSIFNEDVVDNRKAIAWNVWRPLDILLKLYPLHSSTAGGSHCSVTLHIKCCKDYPNKVPKLDIHKLQGLSNENGSLLLQELNKKAATLTGEVMIFDLAYHVQNFLHQYNKPASKSFYDEMLQTHNEIERHRILDQQVKEDDERRKMFDEIQKRQKILQTENKRQPRISISREEDANLDELRNTQAELVFYAENNYTPNTISKKKLKQTLCEVKCTCPNKGIQILRISQKNSKKIHIGKCLGHSFNGSTTYMGIDADTGDLKVVKKWSLPTPKDLQARNKQMNILEQDLAVLSRLQHPVLVCYNTMEVQHESADKSQRNSTSVYLFRDFVQGTSLKHLRSKFNCDMLEHLSLVRTVACGLFSAMAELHAVGLLHRDVRLENIYLDNGGCVKLVGVCLDIQLFQILEESAYHNRYSKVQDVYQSAQVLLSLLTDVDSKQQEVPSNLPSVAKDFFSRCLTEEEQQWSAVQLLAHEFLKQTQPSSIKSKDGDDGYSGSGVNNAPVSSMLTRNSLVNSGSSRLEAEFEILMWLGHGAFGDVLKVKNKLDGGFYAIKRIELNPEKVQLNKKITREVTLLSRLNHENVVRYYNAWIETVQSPLNNDTIDKDSTGTSPKHAQKQKVNANENLSAAVAKLRPGIMLEWSISEATPQQKVIDDDSCSGSSDTHSDDDDDDDGWFKFLPNSVESETSDEGSLVQFEEDTNNKSMTLPSDATSTNDISQTALSDIQIHQVLYIQMEFCEKNTLRHAIDNGLYLEKIRAWRLFREMVEGLSHVHQCGMIHRDLKPVNIFIDSNDHIKIGDFGLATKVFTGIQLQTDEKFKNQEDVGGSMTGQIGTALYVAPELLQAGNKVIYNQKVDIYSLGIILFEMFHQPLTTSMERMKILSDLRCKEVILPQTFVVDENVKQIHVIRWLLNHEPSARPSCAEILASEHVPRAMPEGALAGLITHTLSDKKSRGYQRLITACMEQHFTLAEDLTYDTGFKPKNDLNLNSVKDIATNVFKRHGAIEFSPPLLIPKLDKSIHHSSVKLMTSFGCIVHLPHDLRYPFSRYVAYNDVKCMRRYVVDRVYREKHVPGFHPRELLECAFDIVTPKTVNMWMDAELISIVNSVIKDCGLKIDIQVNHKTILDTVLLACGVPADKHIDLYPVLVDVRTGRITNLQLQTHLTSLCLTTKDTALLLKLIESSVPVNEVKQLLSPLMKRRSTWSSDIARSVRELEQLLACLKTLAIDCPITSVPCLAYNASQHQGIYWQAVIVRPSEHKKIASSKTRPNDIVAVGGRYDALIEQFHKLSKGNQYELRITALGLSMSLERIAALVKKSKSMLDSENKLIDRKKVAVCFQGQFERDKSSKLYKQGQLVCDLWCSDVSVCLVECSNALETRDLVSADVVVTCDDDHTDTVRIAVWNGDSGRVLEKQTVFYDALTTLLDIVKNTNSSNETITNRINEGSSRTSWSEMDKCNNPLINVTIVTNERVSSTTRRRYETQTYNRVCSWTSEIGVGCRSRCNVVGAWCNGTALRTLAATFHRPSVSSQPVHRDHIQLYTLYPREKIIFEEIIDVLNGFSNSKSMNNEPILYFLYSLQDGVLTMIT